jgi:tRNA 2-selenouridine synthase
MVLTLDSVLDPLTAGFDDVIDVRSPAEFADDHLPGAINLPVLDDAERARVGTVYKQVNPFTARKLGAALVARNAARHLEGVLADRPGGWRPLVYCWRGGQRSGSFATILREIGWRVETIAGGYRAWRRLVVRDVHERPLAVPVVVLDGDTGSAKTAILGRLAAQGVQTLDLEDLARHRGSLFGHLAAAQPSQRAFEGALALALARLDPARPVVVEAESALIGACRIPPSLWKAMCAAPRIALAVPRPARARYLVTAYADLTADRDRLRRVIESLRPLHPREVIEGWTALAAAGADAALAEALMAAHYDPRYARHRARMPAPAAVVAAAALDPPALDDLAARVAAAVRALAPAGLSG